MKSPKRRKMLIYGGLAAAMLLVMIFARRSSSSAAAQTPTAQPVTNPAVDPNSFLSGGGGASGIDPSSQLASIDTDIQTMAQAIASLQASSQNPGANTPGTSGTVAPGLDLPGFITAITGAVSTGAAIAGAQRQPGPGNTPAVKPPTKPSTAQHNAQFLAPGAKSPGYLLNPPKGAPKGSVWGGARSPGKAYRGIGGGWYVKK